jgi:drug/metabolite transporter (DMT)-like permease
MQASGTSIRGFDLAVLAAGVCAVSTAALFIREADAPAIVIAAARLSLASLPLLLVTGVQALRRDGASNRVLPGTEQSGKDGRTRLLLTVAAGVFLALHFGFWTASVKQTSIVTTVVLVTSQPLFVAVLAGRLLGERTARDTWLGIALAAAGAAVMVGDDIGRGSDTLLGDLYALLGAVFAACYILAGRSLRASGLGWMPYVTRAYSVAAVLLVAAAVTAGETLSGYSTRTYVFFVLLAAVPQLIGHTALNRSLGYLPAATVAVAILGEPVGATILGAVFLDETPTALQLAGALLVLAGVYAGLRTTLTKRNVAPEIT